MDTTKNYYAILGVLPSAEVETIQAVYRSLSKKYHPDVSREDPEGLRSKIIQKNRRLPTCYQVFKHRFSECLQHNIFLEPWGAWSVQYFLFFSNKLGMQRLISSPVFLLY